jgi:hypothetical protein
MWYINHFSEELTATMTLPSGRTKDDVEHCIYKRLLGAKHGDFGLDNADWQDSCLEGTYCHALISMIQLLSCAGDNTFRVMLFAASNKQERTNYSTSLLSSTNSQKNNGGKCSK